MRTTLSPYEKISFEEATRIIYYHFHDRPSLFKEIMEDLMNCSDEPYMVITPKQHLDYREHLNQNKKGK